MYALVTLAFVACSSGPQAMIDAGSPAGLLTVVLEHLHEADSERLVTDGCPGAVVVFTDRAPHTIGCATDAGETEFHPSILPFRYVYCPQWDHTIVICAIARTVAVCSGHLARPMVVEEIDRDTWAPGTPGCIVVACDLAVGT